MIKTTVTKTHTVPYWLGIALLPLVLPFTVIVCLLLAIVAPLFIFVGAIMGRLRYTTTHKTPVALKYRDDLASIANEKMTPPFGSGKPRC